MAFDITSVLKDVSGPVNGMEQIEYIQLDQIDPDPNNFYSLEGISELADNIATIGLQQPLRVRPGSEPGRFTIVSGHRRRAACMMIRDGEDDCRTMFDQGVPCIVDRGEASIALQELRLIYANAATRIMNPAEISMQAERVEALLYQLKEEGMEFPGRMRDHVAEACRVSKTKLARLHAIRNNLDPGLLKYFDKGELPEETAYQLQRLPKEIQHEAAEQLASGKRKRLPVGSVVREVVEDLDQYQAEMPCQSHAGGPDCHHKTEKIIRSLFVQYSWQVCGCDQCCRSCYHWKDCSGACQETKDRRALEKACEQEKAEKEKAERAKAQERFRASRQMQARRVLPLIEAANFKDDDFFAGKYGYDKVTVKDLKKAAAGEFGEATFYDGELIPDRVTSLKNWADLLDCSIDFLVGRADTPKPAKMSGSDTGWQTGTPGETGDYVIMYGPTRKEDQKTRSMTFMQWNGTFWRSSRTHSPMAGGMTVYRWIKLPEI